MGYVAIVLASASERRSRLLDQIGVAHACHAADVDESQRPGESPVAYVQRLASEKAVAVVDRLGVRQEQPVLAADTTVVLEAPEMGDEVQAIKAGLLEVADTVVVNKSDRPGADRAAAQLRAMLTVGASQDRAAGDRPRPKRPQVMLASALTGAGVADLLAALDRRQDAAGADAARDEAALKRAEAQLSGILAERLSARLNDDARRASTESTLRRIAAHEIDPYSAADQLLASLSDDS